MWIVRILGMRTTHTARTSRNTLFSANAPPHYSSPRANSCIACCPIKGVWVEGRVETWGSEERGNPCFWCVFQWGFKLYPCYQFQVSVLEATALLDGCALFFFFFAYCRSSFLRTYCSRFSSSVRPPSTTIFFVISPGVAVWMRSAPIGSYLWTLGPPLVALLGKVMEPLGGAVLLEEVCRWGWALRLSCLVPLPVLSFCFLCSDELCLLCFLASRLASWSCCHSFSSITIYVPLGTVSQNNPLLPLVDFVRVFYPGNRQATDIPDF